MHGEFYLGIMTRNEVSQKLSPSTMKTFHHLVSRAIDEMLETERQDLRRAPGGAEYALGKASLRIVVTRKTIVGITSNRTAQRAIRELGALRLLRPTKSRPRGR